jgi:molybdenum cofactor synthesis domain-containing protein
VCTSAEKGVAKSCVPQVEFIAGHGLAGDAHAGPWHRQVSLLAVEAIAAMRSPELALDYGAFGENLVIKGVPVQELGIGSELQIGPARLMVTQIGKVCHAPCAIFRSAGRCIMPEQGLFLEVVEGGGVRVGDEVKVTQLVPRSTIQVALMTVSDRAFGGDRGDASGPALRACVEQELGAHVVAQLLRPDDVEAIKQALLDLVQRKGTDLILTSGGTGCGPRDVTPEATSAVIEREVPGLAEHMRAESLRHTPHAMLSRGVAGIAQQSLIINLPGSPAGAVQNLQSVLKALPHAVELIRGQVRDCGLGHDKGGVGSYD